MSIRETSNQPDAREAPAGAATDGVVPHLEVGGAVAAGPVSARARRGALVALPVVLLAAVGAAILLLSSSSARLSAATHSSALAHPSVVAHSSVVAHGSVAARPPRAAGTAKAPVARHAPVGTSTSPAVAESAPVPHPVSSAELLSYADGLSSYRPPGYLVRAYRAVSARYRIPWRLLAAVAYLRGWDADALAGSASRPERVVAREARAAGIYAVNQARLTWALAGAASPSRTLTHVAGSLAADGAADSPGKAAAAYMSGTGVPVETVLTLAAATSPPVHVATALAAIESSPLAHSAPATAQATGLGSSRGAHALPRSQAASTPAAVTTAAGTTGAQGATTTLPASTSVGATAASAPGSSPAATTSSTPPPAPVRARISAMLDEARLLNGLPYIWGGGHTNPAWVTSAGYDCSGFVSEVLHAAGYLTSPETTQTLPGAAGILNGPGRYVTIYDRTIATLRVWVKKRRLLTVKRAVNPSSIGVHVTKGRRASSPDAVSIRLPRWVGEWRTVKLTRLVPSLDTSNNDEHVIIDIDGHWWESGGSSTDGGASMVHPITDPSLSYLRSFNRILHPVGL